MTHTIFIVDDDETQLMLLKKIVVDKLHYRAITASGGRQAIERFLLRSDPKPDLLLVDLLMPEVNGLDVIKAIRRVNKHLPIIVLSAYGGMQHAVEAVRAGANDFLLKPTSIERLKLSIRNLLQQSVLMDELERLSRHSEGTPLYSDIIGKSRLLQDAMQMSRKATDSNVPVVIEGEKGTGKEQLARVIHGAGRRSNTAFTSLHCAALSDDEVQQFFRALMGQEQVGRLPDAYKDFRIEQNGTLFLRNVNDLSLEAQRLLHEWMCSRCQRDYPAQQWRVITSTNRPLLEDMRSGYFREDLYFMLNVLTIKLPPLRDRGEDILMLAEHFMRKYSAMEDAQVTDMATETKQLLMQHSWPGNICELAQVMHRAVLKCDGVVLLPFHMTDIIEKTGGVFIPENQLSMQDGAAYHTGLLRLITKDGNIKSMHEIEAELIQYAIKHYKGKMSEVARRLGIGRSTLYRKIQDYKLDQAA